MFRCLTLMLVAGVLTLGAIAPAMAQPADAPKAEVPAATAPAPAATTPAADASGGDAIGSLPAAYYLAPAGAIIALIMAFVFYKGFMASSEGDDNMVRIAAAVRAGAYAYLRASWKVVFIVFIILMAVLAAMAFGLKLQAELTFVGVGVAGFLSGLCGYFGMKTATNASARTAHAAKQSLNDGLKVAFRAGAVMGLCVTGFALLDVSVWFYLLSQIFHVDNLTTLTTITLSFAMGASLQALFARVGGGIYTKAADVGADLVGKVEAGIPEDDARNPATIADNVGDNVGDVAGMGADLYESYYGSILAAMALAAAGAYRLGLNGHEALSLVIAPAALAGLGIIASVLSIFVVRTKEGASMAQLLTSLHTGVWVSSALIVAGSAGLLYWLVGSIHHDNLSWVGIWVAILAGLLAGLVIAKGTEYYTSYENKPTKRIAEQSETGPATVIISGVAEGMISTWIPLLTTIVAILVAFIAAGGNKVFLMGVFGVAIAAVGMLSTLGITLATDAYGPIADNAGGNAEMTHQPAFVRERTDMLDSLGNTTAATGKGFAIGSAALTALALLAAYLITVQSSLVTQVQSGPDGYQGHGLIKWKDEAYVITDMSAFEVAVDKVSEGQGRVAGVQPLPGEAMWQARITGDGTDAGPFKGIVPVQPLSIRGLSLPQLMAYYDVSIMSPKVLCGLFVGVMLVFVFCAMTMSAVGRAANQMMLECRRQFGIMKAAFKKGGMTDADIANPNKWPFEVTSEGKSYPDYANCVAISTQGALKEMIVPSLLAVVVPITLGLVLGVSGVMGMLAGALVTGFAVAIFMANAGGAWDNAKKYIETGQHGGKGSANHKATVVGDTVGDPFKDTSGPSLNILIKLISVVSVVFAGLIVKFSPMIGDLLGLG